MNEQPSSWGLKSCGSIKRKFMFWEWITIKFASLPGEEKRSRSPRFGGGDLRQGLARQGQKQGGAGTPPMSGGSRAQSLSIRSTY